MAEKKRDERTRNWTFVLYPESAPEQWRTYLDDMHIQWVESPLHDADLNGDGTQKKPHWHVALLFEGNKSFEQIKEITDALNAPIPQKIASIRSMIRYMAHIDNPEKEQYKISDVIGHGGVDVAEYLKPSSLARYEIIREMITFIKERNICEYTTFMNYACEYEPEWFYLLCDSATYVISQYIKSNRHRIIKVDKDTGEVIENGFNGGDY